MMTGQVGEAVGPLPPIGPGDHSIGSAALADPAHPQHINFKDKGGKVCRETSDVICVTQMTPTSVPRLSGRSGIRYGI